MVYTLIDHRNDVIKFQNSSGTTKFRTFYSIMSMVYKSVVHGKLWLICFLQNINFFTKNQKQNNRHCMTCNVISMIYTLIDHSSRPISARGLAQLL